MRPFVMNGYLWKVESVDRMDPMLVDRTGKRTVATTDPESLTVYLSDELSGDFLVKVVLHELGHCAMHSFGLIDDIHSMVYPEHWIDAEEWICNFIADYGFRIFSAAYDVVGYDALNYIPKEIEKLAS